MNNNVFCYLVQKYFSKSLIESFNKERIQLQNKIAFKRTEFRLILKIGKKVLLNLNKYFQSDIY